MRALYFGTYDRAYPRNAQVISALRGAGAEVREQHRPVWERRRHWPVGLRQLLRVAPATREAAGGRADATAHLTNRLHSPWFRGAAVCVDPFRAQTPHGGRARICSAHAEAAGELRAERVHTARGLLNPTVRYALD